MKATPITYFFLLWHHSVSGKGTATPVESDKIDEIKSLKSIWAVPELNAKPVINKVGFQRWCLLRSSTFYSSCHKHKWHKIQSGKTLLLLINNWNWWQRADSPAELLKSTKPAVLMLMINYSVTQSSRGYDRTPLNTDWFYLKFHFDDPLPPPQTPRLCLLDLPKNRMSEFTSFHLNIVFDFCRKHKTKAL